MSSLFPRTGSAKTYTVLGVVGCVTVLLAALYAYMLYMVDQRASEVASLSHELEEHLTRERTLSALEGALTAHAALFEDMNRYMIGRDDIVGLIEEIESLGVHTGVAIDISSARVESGRDARAILQFTSSGSFADTFYLLSLLDTMPMRVHFTRVQFDREGSEGNTWRGVFHMEIRSFLDRP
jgi:hypothetical protein